MKDHLQEKNKFKKIQPVAEKGQMGKTVQRHRLSSGSSEAGIYLNIPATSALNLAFLVRGSKEMGYPGCLGARGGVYPGQVDQSAMRQWKTANKTQSFPICQIHKAFSLFPFFLKYLRMQNCLLSSVSHSTRIFRWSRKAAIQAGPRRK